MEHKEDFIRAREQLWDSKSKNVLDAIIAAGEQGEIVQLINLSEPRQYFNELTYVEDPENEVFADYGAYNGDTILDYNSFTCGRFKKIYAFETSQPNMDILRKQTCRIANVDYLEKSTWPSEDVLNFSEDLSASQFEENGSIQIPVDSIDNVVRGEVISFIKMDVEGGEYQTLLGA